MHVVDAPHLRVLRLLRDEGPVSRAELGDRLELTRPRLLAEVDRLVAAGLIAEAGMAARVAQACELLGSAGRSVLA